MLDFVLSATPEIRNLQSRCARLLFRIGVSANVATMLALLAGIVSGLAFARGGVMLGLIALAVSAGLDAIDGTIAREFAAPSIVGGVLDLTADRVVETFVIVGIAWRDPALYFPALMLVGGRRRARASWSKADRLPARNFGAYRGDYLFRSARDRRGYRDFASARADPRIRDDRAGDRHWCAAVNVRDSNVARAT